MKNNKKEILIWMLIVLMIIVTIMATVFLPDTVPMHYDLKGEVNRWGSKYENFILVILTISFGLFLKIYSDKLKKTANSNEDYKSAVDAKKNIVVVEYTNIGVLLMFNIMNIGFLYMQFHYTNNTSTAIEFDIYKVITIVSAIMFIVIGNVIPKCKINSVVGIRTPWSMKNDIAWLYSQRYGGITFIIAGIIIIVGACFLKQIFALIFMSVVLGIATIICIYLSYVSYKKSLELTKK